MCIVIQNSLPSWNLDIRQTEVFNSVLEQYLQEGIKKNKINKIICEILIAF